MEFDETLQEGRSQCPLPSLCFSGRWEKQDGRPGLWLAETFSTSPRKPLNGIQQNLTGSKIPTSSTKFVFFGPIGKTRWPPWPLIGWDILDFSSETAERNSTKLDRKQDLNVLYQVCIFRADRKNKMAALASDWLRHFRLLLCNRWTEFKETWQEGNLNVLYQVCVFPADQINKMAALASDWLRHFRLLLWNRWTEFKETLQEARSQRPLPSLCFSGRSEKQDGHPGLWLAETFSTSPLQPLNGIQQNLTESKISTSSTKFVFFGPIGKTRWPLWPIRQKGCTLYSGARYVALWASCWWMVKHGFLIPGVKHMFIKTHVLMYGKKCRLNVRCSIPAFHVYALQHAFNACFMYVKSTVHFLLCMWEFFATNSVSFSFTVLFFLHDFWRKNWICWGSWDARCVYLGPQLLS